MEDIAVIKLGGHAMDEGPLLDAFIGDIAKAVQKKIRLVIVHGGGPQISSLLSRLAIRSEFCDGLRVTDQPALEAVEMALCGQVNKYLTRRLLEKDVAAAGICGEDCNLLKAAIKDPRLGLVGRITAVNPEILQILLKASITPVIAPLATDAHWQPLNVNADTAAGAIAGSLKAQAFILISDVPGVLAADGRLLPGLNEKEIREMIANGVISGGMIPKVNCCLDALEKGAAKAVILDGTASHSLRDYFAGDTVRGTVIGK